MDLTEADAANELMRLAKAVAHHNRLYHAHDAPEISDAEYDALVRENNALEAAFPHLVREDSPNKAVGAAPAGHLSKVTHAKPMLSLDNTYSSVELREFDERVRKGAGLGSPAAIWRERAKKNCGADRPIGLPVRTSLAFMPRSSVPEQTRTKAMRSRWFGSMLAWILKTKALIFSSVAWMMRVSAS